VLRPCQRISEADGIDHFMVFDRRLRTASTTLRALFTDPLGLRNAASTDMYHRKRKTNNTK
ncbi:MAG: hypothetical protein WBW79_13910, partial [Desulfocapsaceae bacterium]